jgi:hypothetical protein
MVTKSRFSTIIGETTSIALIGALLLLLGGTLTTAQAASKTLRAAASNAAAATDPGTFLVSYFDVSFSDNNVRIVNPTKVNGSICAMIYVFDASEEMGECCGCPISPNGLLYGTVKSNLLRNWATGGNAPGAGVIKIVSAMRTGSSCPTDDPACNVGGDFTSSPAIACDPTSESTQTPVANLSAWMTHSEAVGIPADGTKSDVIGNPVLANSVDAFSDEGSTDSAEGVYLPQECENLISNGSGNGWCRCPVPDFHDNNNS